MVTASSSDVLEEDVGPLVSFEEFQAGRSSLAQYLLRRTSAASWAEKGTLSRSMRLSLRCARFLGHHCWQKACLLHAMPLTPCCLSTGGRALGRRHHCLEMQLPGQLGVSGTHNI